MNNDQWNDNRDDDQNEDLGSRGDKDTLRGKANQAAGKVQEKAGDVLNNDEMQRHGQEKQIKGHIQEGAGDVERKADDILDDDH
ncbi:MAG TPA: CsbD family protein [Ktedonobacterales bacterium]|nr:CsbD family protein [Ktedonobacterales bacterium]